MSDVQAWIKETVTKNRVVLFMKGNADYPECGFSSRAIQILNLTGIDDLVTINVLDDNEIREGVKAYSNWPTIPQLFVSGEFIGGADIISEMHDSGELETLLKK